MSYKSFLKHRCNIWRYQEVVGEKNVTKNELVKISENVPCRKVMRTTRNILEKERNKVVGTYILHLLKGTDIQNGDVVEIGTEKFVATEPNPASGHHIETLLNREDEL